MMGTNSVTILARSVAMVMGRSVNITHPNRI